MTPRLFSPTSEARDDRPQFFPPLLARVLHAAEATEVGEGAHARALLDGILADASATGPPHERLARVFALSLLARLRKDGSGSGNLYLEQPNPRDMLAAFDALNARTPLIRFGHVAANTALLDAIGDAAQVHVVDLGIGTGAQWGGFLEALAARPGGPPSVRITGVDLPLPGPRPDARLKAVGESLRATARALDVPFEYAAIPARIEDVRAADLDVRPDEALVVNAAFALHHVPAEPAGTERNDVLRMLRDLRPRALTLVEPDAEHNALPFLPRVREALAHYGAVFEVLEHELPREMDARRALEHAFFGREVLNVVTGEGLARVERHERHAQWSRRMHAAGFEPVPVGRVLARVREEVPVSAPFGIEAVGAGVALSWRVMPLVVASAWEVHE